VLIDIIFDEITQPGSTPPVVTGPTLPLDFESGICFC
jgi:hypothetical protein